MPALGGAGRPTMDTDTAAAAAKLAGALGSELNGVSLRVFAMEVPVGVKPDVAGRLAGAATSIGRAGLAVESHAPWIRWRATLFLAADAASGVFFIAGVNDGGPRLRSPLDPGTPQTPFSKAFVATFVELWTNFQATQAYGEKLRYHHPRWGRPDPTWYLDANRREMGNEVARGLAAGARKPHKFALALVADLFAYNEFADGDISGGFGKLAGNTVQMVFPVGKVLKVARTGGRLSHAKVTNHHRDRVRDALGAKRDARHQTYRELQELAGAAPASAALREAAKQSKDAWEKATDTATTARERAASARTAVGAAQRPFHDALRDVPQGVRDKTPTTAADVGKEAVGTTHPVKGTVVGVTHDTAEDDEKQKDRHVSAHR